MRSTDAEDDGTAEDQAYFRAIEESFLRLRGSGTLLAAADWQMAREWRRSGVPLELVIETLETLFERLRQRRSKRGISSLRYFRAAVAAAWDQELEVRSGGARRFAAQPLLVKDRLARLAASLPAELPRREHFAEAIVALSGTVAEVEPELAELDRDLLSALAATLSAAASAELDHEVIRTLAAHAGRLSASERTAARARLRDQALRRRWHLAVLSLFAPEAQEPDSD